MRGARHRRHHLPGPSAPLAALVLSGLPSDRFLFAGFLPPRQGQRGTALAEVAAVPATLLFFETGPRLAESLAQMATVLGDRPAAVARELTKLHEEVRRGPLSALAAHYEQAGPPRARSWSSSARLCRPRPWGRRKSTGNCVWPWRRCG